ncbi:MAG: hypothetical protein KDK65_05600, partial [Chlamydiia bacterium]|nr:hypothetical protein [Chlamydiia bacterium]
LGDDFGIVSNKKKRIDVWMGKGKLSTKPQQQDVLAQLKEDPSRLCERRFFDQCLIASREQTPPDHTPTTDCETVRWQLLRGDLDLDKGWHIFWESKELSPLERIEVAEHTLNALSLKPLPNDPKQLAQMLEMSTHVDWVAQPSRTKQWIRETLHPHIKEQQTAVTNHWLLLKGKALTTQVDIDHLTADTCLPEKIQSHPHYKQLFGTANPQCAVNGIPNQTGVSFTFKIGERTFRILSLSDALHFEQILTFENGVTEVYRWQEAPTERFFKERGVWLNREKPTEGRTFLKHPIETLEECFITTDSNGNLTRTAYNGLQLVESLDFPAILPKEKMLFWRHPHSKAIYRIDFGSHSLERDAVDKPWKMGKKELLTGLQRAEVFRTFFADVNAEEWSFELTHKGEHELLFFPFSDETPLSLSYHQEKGIRGSADAWLALAHRFIQKDIPDKAEQCLENALAASKAVEHRQKLFTLFDTIETSTKKGQLLKAKCLLFLRDDQLRDEIAQPTGAPDHPEWNTIEPKIRSKHSFQCVTEEEVSTAISHALTSWQEKSVNDFSPKSVRTHFFALWNRIIAEGLKPHDLLELCLPADPTTHLMQRTLLTLATQKNGTQIDLKAINNLLPHRYTDTLFSYPTRQRIEHLITACQVIAESPANPNPENKKSIKLDKLLHARTITRTHTLNEQEGEPNLTPESYRAYLRGQLPKVQADRLTKYLRSKKNSGTKPSTRHELFFEAMTKKSKPFEVAADLLPKAPAIPFDSGFPQTEPHWEVIPGFDSKPLKEAFQKNVSIKPENLGQLHLHYFALMQHKSVLKKKLEEVFPQFEMQLPALKERYKRLELEKGHELLTAWFFYETALKTYSRCIQSYLLLLQELKEKHAYPNEPQWVAIATQIKHELDYAFNYTRFAEKTDLKTACQIVAEAEAGRELTPDALNRLDHPPVTVT